MTAGKGILHQEMPKGDQQGRMHGFELWANLPSSLKMTDPRYQYIPASVIPEITDDDGTHVRVICGDFWGKRGTVEGVAADPHYLDISVAPGQRKRLKVETTRNAFGFLLVSARPTEAPVAWYGPIVMNTQDQLRPAMADLHNDTFIRQR